jgi:hypothetical protein
VACIQDLQQAISRRQDSLDRAMQRESFKKKIPPLNVNEVHIFGVSPSETRYLKRISGFATRKAITDWERFYQRYYKLKKYGNFESIFFEFYATSDSTQGVKLFLEKKPPLLLGIGGTFFSPIDHQLQLYFRYTGLSARGFVFDGILERGSFENRFAFALKYRFPISNVLQWHFLGDTYEQNFLRSLPLNASFYSLNKANLLLSNLQLETGFRSSLGLRSEWGVHGALFRTQVSFPSNGGSADTLFKNFLVGARMGGRVYYSNLNYRQYPTDGRSLFIGLSYIQGVQYHHPPISRVPILIDTLRGWFFTFRYDEYGLQLRPFVLGFSVSVGYSSLPDLKEETATRLLSPRFVPFEALTPIYLPYFFSKAYAGGVVSPILSLSKQSEIRGGFYAYFDLARVDLLQSSPQSLVTQAIQSRFGGSIGYVYKTSLFPIGAFLYYHPQSETPFQLLLHLGFMLFQGHPWE